MSLDPDIPALRHAARQLVRELKLLEGRCCGGELSLSEAHFLIELAALGEATCSDLADRLVLEKSTVSRLCSALEGRDLIQCCAPDAEAADKRRKPLRLTPAGADELRGIDLVADHQVAEALSYVGSAERAEVVHGLARYARALHYARLARDYTLRPIERDDNPAVAALIRQVMSEFGAVGTGYSINDPEVDDMHGAYPAPEAGFWVIERDGRILGCGGVGPLAGVGKDTCELRKMYFLPELRGLGLGTRLLNHCLAFARRAGYAQCYLETLASMHHARKLYAKHGFELLDAPMGATGHSGCNTWMIRRLDASAGPVPAEPRECGSGARAA